MIEGERTRVQNFEGVCIARANNGIGSSFTVRKISFGEGVERVFPLYSPNVDSIEVVRRGDVRRAKLYYLRGRTGKSARIAERRDTRRDVAGGQGAETEASAPRTRREPEPSRKPNIERRGASVLRLFFACELAVTVRHAPLPSLACLLLLAAAAAPALRRADFTLERRFRQPVADRADAARAEAVAGRRFVTLLEQPRRRPGPLRPLGDRHRDRRRRGCWSIQQKIGCGGADLRGGEDAPRAGAASRAPRASPIMTGRRTGRSILVPIDGDLYLAALDGNVRRLTNTPADRDRRQGLAKPAAISPSCATRICIVMDARRQPSDAADQRRRRHAELGRGRVRRAGGDGPPHRLLVVAGRPLHRGRPRRRKPGRRS